MTAPSLADWLLSCVDDVETLAREALDAAPDWPKVANAAAGEADAAAGWHVLRNDPARVLANCAALRAVVASCRSDYEDALTSGDDTGDLATEVLTALAAQFAGRAGWRDEWK